MDPKNILVTGGAGFVGSHLAVSLKREFPRSGVWALDNLKRRGSEFNLPRLRESGVKFVHGDIRSEEDLDLAFDLDLILECSAEPSVMAGYGVNPKYVIQTNLTGTVNCLELARKKKSAVIFLSTSRVYPYDLLSAIPTRETPTRLEWDLGGNTLPGLSYDGVGLDFPLTGPKSMYGATKLASELLMTEYMAMYGIRGIVNRCGLIAGPWQFGKVDQGVVTLWMLAHYFKKKLNYIGFGGTGKQVRDVLHVQDLFELIVIQIRELDALSGEIFNMGGGIKNSVSLQELSDLCTKLTGNRVEIGRDPNNRPADIPVFITDNDKVTKRLNWKPKRDLEETLANIFDWVKQNESVTHTLL
ncbi:MAG: 3-beta hydroxysteroid dehydrogenase [Nitrospinae bacterium CG11_big_fil_rev_8_21_14_0_20_56_8]|nr:MAG: 3-beta hydroxysteroid dehydrogenase [Nitrospinae bacterium CG11_big_fil_rev_8_21_14_0_20_56_8]